MITRKEFFHTLAGFAASALVPFEVLARSTSLPGSHSSPLPAASSKSKVKRGVSLYSFQDQLKLGVMNLDDCISAVSDLGADGIEILGEETVPDFPAASDQFVDHWRRLMKKYRTRPSCYDNFIEFKLYKDRLLTTAESVEMMVRDIKLAKQLDYKIMRTLVTTSPEVVEATLPYLEQYDMKMGIEIHSPNMLNSKWMDDFTGLIARTKTKHFGFVPDLSLFVKRPPRIQEAWNIRNGAQPKVVEYIGKAYQDGVPQEKAEAEVIKMGGNEVDRNWLAGAYHYGPITNNPKDLSKIMPYIFHIHAKVYEMTDEYKEWSIPYEEIVPVLIEGGYEGYLSTEYEGQRHFDDAFDIDGLELEQVRRHHVMMKKLLGEA